MIICKMLMNTTNKNTMTKANSTIACPASLRSPDLELRRVTLVHRPHFCLPHKGAGTRIAHRRRLKRDIKNGARDEGVERIRDSYLVENEIRRFGIGMR